MLRRFLFRVLSSLSDTLTMLTCLGPLIVQTFPAVSSDAPSDSLTAFSILMITARLCPSCPVPCIGPSRPRPSGFRQMSHMHAQIRMKMNVNSKIQTCTDTKTKIDNHPSTQTRMIEFKFFSTKKKLIRISVLILTQQCFTNVKNKMYIITNYNLDTTTETDTNNHMLYEY